MVARTLSHWLLFIALAVFTLVTINLLVATAHAQSRHAANLVNCSGSIQACSDAASDGDTILIAAGAYTESLTLSKPISLTGVNSATTIIHAIAGQRVLTVTASTISNSVVISGLTFTGGITDTGGSIRNDGKLKLENCQIRDNIAIGIDGASGVISGMGGNALGGGIYNSGTLILNQCIINGNTARGGNGVVDPYQGGAGGDGEGGGIYNNGTLILDQCSINGNANTGGNGGGGRTGFGGNGRGGGIYSTRTLSLNQCNVTGNAAAGVEP